MIGDFRITVYSEDTDIYSLHIMSNCYWLSGDIVQTPNDANWLDAPHKRVCDALHELEDALTELARARNGVCAKCGKIKTSTCEKCNAD